MVAGHTKDLAIDPQGNLPEVEEEVQPDALPGSVLGSLRAQAGKGRITKIELLMEHGKIVAMRPRLRSGKGSRKFRSDRMAKNWIMRSNRSCHRSPDAAVVTSTGS